MRRYVVCILLQLAGWTPAQASIPSKIMDDISDTLATGMPIALFSGLWWAVANRIPRKWLDLSDPAATFIRTTWKEQGLAHPEKIILKEIPATSFLAKIVMYTQELPHALAVGTLFKQRIEDLLHEKSYLESEYACELDKTKREYCEKRLQEVEHGLAECRFVCGHERVHKERSHTYRMLLIQFIAPFIFHSLLKHSANALDRHELWPVFSAFLRKNTTRSLLEMITFWVTAHIFEREADLHASMAPAELKAGIHLFTRAQEAKAERSRSQELRTFILLWVLKYTHPTLPERLGYLRKALKKAERLQHAVRGKRAPHRRKV